MICFLIFLLLGIVGVCQDDFPRQYKLIKKKIKSPYETLLVHTDSWAEVNGIKRTFFIDYIIDKYSKQPNLIKHISNRNYLIKLNSIVSKENAGFFLLESNKRVKVYIEKETKPLKGIGEILYDTVSFFKNESAIIRIRTVNSKSVMGLMFDTSIVSVFKSISVTSEGETTFIDQSVLGDLYFPNLCETNYEIKPLEIYLSTNKKFLYLYLWGGQRGAVYFCKIIYDLAEKKTVGRIIADNNELGSFKCLSAANIIGF